MYRLCSLDHIRGGTKYVFTKNYGWVREDYVRNGEEKLFGSEDEALDFAWSDENRYYGAEYFTEVV